MRAYPEEAFGIKPETQPLYVIESGKNLEGAADLAIDAPKEFVQKYGLPKGWELHQVMDYLALHEGEFDLLSPKKGILSARQVGRSIMQIFEAYSDAELYIGAKDYPQTLKQYEELAKWAIKNGFVRSKASRTHVEGLFHEGSVKSLIEGY